MSYITYWLTGIPNKGILNAFRKIGISVIRSKSDYYGLIADTRKEIKVLEKMLKALPEYLDDQTKAPDGMPGMQWTSTDESGNPVVHRINDGDGYSGPINFDPDFDPS